MSLAYVQGRLWNNVWGRDLQFPAEKRCQPGLHRGCSTEQSVPKPRIKACFPAAGTKGGVIKVLEFCHDGKWNMESHSSFNLYLFHYEEVEDYFVYLKAICISFFMN